MKRVISFIFLFILIHAKTVLAQNYFEITSSTINKLAAAGSSLKEHGTVETVKLALENTSGISEINLIPHDIRAKNYNAEITLDDGRVADEFEVKLFKSSTGKETASSFYRFALVSKKNATPHLFGFYAEAGNYFQLSPASGRSSNKYETQVLTKEQIDAFASKVNLYERLIKINSPKRSVKTSDVTVGTYVAEIATEADYEFTARLGSQTSANAAILTILNAVDAIYQAQLNLSLSVSYQHAWATSSDPYSSSNSETLLSQFVNYWESNAGSINYDFAHMWTGREIDSSVVGIAYLASVCTQYSYGLSQFLNLSSLDVPLVAHEIAHNFGADHDTCSAGQSWIMCPVLQNNQTQFSPTSRSDIALFNSDASCLTTYGGQGGGTNPSNAPVLSAIGSKTVTELSSLQFDVSATDSDGGTLTYSASPLPTGASFSGQRFTYTPSISAVAPGQGYSKTLNVVFTVRDSTGLSDSETVAITVLNLNQTPVFRDPSPQSTSVGEVFSYDLQVNDYDLDSLSFSVMDTLSAGLFLDRATGLLSWSPAQGQSGTYTLHFKVRDPYGAEDETELEITVSESSSGRELPLHYTRNDFDGNGASDLTVFRNNSFFNYNGQWFDKNISDESYNALSFGYMGDIPLAGDYNGDNISDRVLYRPSSSTWYIVFSGSGNTFSTSFGISTDIPLGEADFDGDGRTDLAVFRPQMGAFVYQPSSGWGEQASISLGQNGDIPLVCDFDGDGISEAAVYMPSYGKWSFSDGLETLSFGERADIPLAGDFNADGICEVMLFRPRTAEWIKQDGSAISFGQGSDVPILADFNGDGGLEYAVWRVNEAMWYVRESEDQISSYQFGLWDDVIPATEPLYYAMRNTNSNSLSLKTELSSFLTYRLSNQTLYISAVSGAQTARAGISASSGSYIVKGYYDTDSQEDYATFNSGVWMFHLSSGYVVPRYWGVAGDLPVSGDFDGDGVNDIAVYRPNDDDIYSRWYIIRSSDTYARVIQWGLSWDNPVPADYNGDGWTDFAVFRPGEAMWYIMDARSETFYRSEQWGLPNDIPSSADFNSDGRADKIVWRPSNGYWFVNSSSGLDSATQWGLTGDIPVAGRYSGDSISFAVFRPSNLTLYVLSQEGIFSYKTISGAKASDNIVGVQPFSALR